MNTLVKLVKIVCDDLRYCERNHQHLNYNDINCWYNQDVGIIRAAVLFLKAENRKQTAIYLLKYCERNIWKKYDKLLDRLKNE